MSCPQMRQEEQERIARAGSGQFDAMLGAVGHGMMRPRKDADTQVGPLCSSQCMYIAPFALDSEAAHWKVGWNYLCTVSTPSCVTSMCQHCRIVTASIRSLLMF